MPCADDNANSDVESHFPIYGQESQPVPSVPRYPLFLLNRHEEHSDINNDEQLKSPHENFGDSKDAVSLTFKRAVDQCMLSANELEDIESMNL